MADNIGYTPGTGATVAADDVSGVLYQRVKLAFGADGSASDVANGNGLPVDTGLNPLTDVQLRASALPLPVGAATEATLASMFAAFKAEDSASADGDLGMVLLAQRRDSDTTAVSNDGDYATLKLDEAGRL